jgi:hypothetical protein
MTSQQSIDDTKSLYQKLVRSFERRPLYGESQVDWVFDMAVTAWHLVDWHAKETGVNLGVAQKRLKKACPDLAVCEQICNGAKHLVLDDPNLKPFDVTSDVYRTDDLMGISRSNVVGGETNVDIILTPVVQVRDRLGRTSEAIDLFRKVVAFWQKELGQ